MAVEALVKILAREFDKPVLIPTVLYRPAVEQTVCQLVRTISLRTVVGHVKISTLAGVLRHD